MVKYGDLVIYGHHFKALVSDVCVNPVLQHYMSSQQVNKFS